MIWPGTIAGTLLGYAAADIPGALLGALLGQVLDRRLKLQSLADIRARLWQPVDRDVLLFSMLGRLAKRDGVVRDAHIRQARAEMNLLGFDSVKQRKAIDAFSRGKTEELKLHVPLGRLKRDREGAAKMLAACWRMANTERRASAGSRELIFLWGKWMGWSAAEVESLGMARRAKPTPPALGEQARYAEAMRVLGVSRDTPPEAVKKAYRRLLSVNHPDKLAGQGAGADKIREATEKTRVVQQAYQLVRQVRNFR
ncbi:DnaJ domain-containing protein [Pseudomonas matsuisoli]|uniref:Molecular chaperone DjlA n=1 Tax=Pseudomonas matsuisoli TaxID=1515666 RepID=A0A917PZH5_9PSED|nr:DnaJ domain-containing protein [Pseudomonas matsuisoli]GGK02069.1 molecular chaperone DjlA [Pseudomonas matsuisoli]